MPTKKTVLIIGAGSTIGQAVAQTMTEAGHNVICTHFHTEIKQGGAIRCDLRDFEQVKVLFDVLPKQIDILVTAAIPYLEASALDFEGYMAIRPFLDAHVYIMIEAAKRMRNGKIFNMLGQYVDRGLPSGPFYSGAFAFLHNLGHSLNAREGKQRKVSVLDLLLGPVETREWDGLSAEVVAEYRSKVSQFVPPQLVADTVRFWSEQPVMPTKLVLDAGYGYSG